MKNYEFCISNIKGKITVKDFLKSKNISSQVIRDLSKQFGLIKINNQPKRTIDYLVSGDKLNLSITESTKNSIIPIEHPLKIVYEDEYFLLVYKPSGVATIPSKSNYDNSLANYVCAYMQNYNTDFIFRALNRLDKQAQGYVVIAKDKLIYSLLFDNIQKYYTCVCEGKLVCKEINSLIKTIKQENGKNKLKRQIDKTGKICNTNIVDVYYNAKTNTSKARIYITTGRTHQIRLHLASSNHAILGDEIYGTKKDIPLQLYCNEIYIFHPILNKTLHFLENIDNELIWN